MYLLIFPFVAVGLLAKIANKKILKDVSSKKCFEEVDFNSIVKSYNHQSTSNDMWGFIQNEDVKQRLQEREFTK